MFLIPRRQIWTQQPQGLVGLSDDVTEYSPVFATVCGVGNTNLVNGTQPTSIVNARGVSRGGVGLQGDTTAGGGRSSYAVQTRGQQLTIVVNVTPGAYVTSYPMLLETDPATEAYTEGSFFLLPYYRYSGVQPNYWSLAVNPSGGLNDGYATALIPAPTPGVPHTIVCRLDRTYGGFSVIRDVHIDGVKQAISIDDGIPLLEQIPAGSQWNSNNLYINSRSGNSLYGNHLVHAAALFASNPPESVARRWSENPWQIFKRPDSRIFVPVSAGGPTAYTLDSQPGSVAVAGSAATLKASRTLSAGPGAVAIVGASATLKVSRKLAASAGAVAIVGAAATCKVSRKLNAAAGSVTISVASAELAYTPVGASLALNAEPGSVTIVGASATLKASRKLAADAGSITIAGADAAMVRYFAGRSLNAQPGSITIAGAEAGYRRQYKLLALPGSVTITGAAAQLVYTGALGPYTRAPSGSGPTVIQPGSIRLRQSATSRPSNTGGRRY